MRDAFAGTRNRAAERDSGDPLPGRPQAEATRPLLVFTRRTLRRGSEILAPSGKTAVDPANVFTSGAQSMHLRRPRQPVREPFAAAAPHVTSRDRRIRASNRPR